MIERIRTWLVAMIAEGVTQGINRYRIERALPQLEALTAAAAQHEAEEARAAEQAAALDRLPVGERLARGLPVRRWRDADQEEMLQEYRDWEAAGEDQFTFQTPEYQQACRVIEARKARAARLLRAGWEFSTAAAECGLPLDLVQNMEKEIHGRSFAEHE